MTYRQLRRTVALTSGLLTVVRASPSASEVRTLNTEEAAAARPVALAGVDFRPRVTIFERSGCRRLRIAYKITNRTGAPLLVFDQGDTNNPGGEYGATCIEPQAEA